MSLITTALSYPNDKPHIGHLYESILADFTCRVLRLYEPSAALLTGVDEHGKKMAKTAESQGITPQTLCAINAAHFQAMNQSAQVHSSFFVRTSEACHHQLVRQSIAVALQKQDIYKSVYSGWYSTREESYISGTEARLTNFCDPLTQTPYEKVEQEAYFFRLSNFNEYKTPCVPAYSTVHGGELNKDISISRSDVDWGIPFETEPSWTVYVWFDALLGYTTGYRAIFGQHERSKTDLILHVIGRDIQWFHECVYPAILLSSNLESQLPTRLLVHGLILDQQGRKMSKSLGNVIGPADLLMRCTIDMIRFYFISETIWGADLKFSEIAMKSNFEDFIVKQYGNLYQRLISMLGPWQDEYNDHVDQLMLIKPNPDTIMGLCEVEAFRQNFNIQEYMTAIRQYVQAANLEITRSRLWDLLSTDFETGLQGLVKCMRLFTYASYLLQPVIPLSVCRLLNNLIESKIESDSSNSGEDITIVFPYRVCIKVKIQAFAKMNIAQSSEAVSEAHEN